MQTEFDSNLYVWLKVHIPFYVLYEMCLFVVSKDFALQIILKVY